MPERPLSNPERPIGGWASGVPRLSDYPEDVAEGHAHCGGRRLGRLVPRPPGDGYPLVSVVTVVRNGVASFRRTAESVWSQTYPAVEYIVVDGGSTDGTRELIESLGDHIDLWISEPDDGISDAFNKGIALARGEVVGLINSDDWYEPDAVAAAVTALKRSELTSPSASCSIGAAARAPIS